MELTPATSARYARHALHQMLAVADRLGEERVNERPVGSTTNSVASLIVHCCGVAEFWLGHVGLGRPSQRSRDDEFAATATLAELSAMVAAALAQIETDLTAIGAGTVSELAAGRQFLLDGDETDASLIVHVLEELYQHLGHAELAADILSATS